jgi:hypothetical protein
MVFDTGPWILAVAVFSGATLALTPTNCEFQCTPLFLYANIYLYVYANGEKWESILLFLTFKFKIMITLVMPENKTDVFIKQKQSNTSLNPFYNFSEMQFLDFRKERIDLKYFIFNFQTRK